MAGEVKTCKIGLQMEELIGLPQYSNVRIAPQVMELEVEDSPEARAAGFKKLGEEVGEALAIQRGIVLDSVKAFAKTGGYGDARAKQ